MTAAQKIIMNFMTAENKVSFYTSAVDGTPCVEWLSFSRYERATEVDLARRILRHKKDTIRAEKRIEAKRLAA